MAEFTAEQLAFQAFLKENNVAVYSVITPADVFKATKAFQEGEPYVLKSEVYVAKAPEQETTEVVEVDGIAQEAEALANEVG